MHYRNRHLMILVALTVMAGLLMSGAAVAGGRRVFQEKEPDLTKGEKDENRNDWDKPWALGPTGALGWIWACKGKQARQIEVAEVQDGTPAARALRKGDIIIGVVSPSPPSANGLFVNDARKELSAAITEAEKQENSGKLVLKVWRAGKTFEATIMLEVMGSYSETWPFDCPKSDKIIKKYCEVVEERGFSGGVGIAQCVNALALLATGDKKYHSVVRPLAKQIAASYGSKRDIRNAKAQKGKTSWQSGYSNLFLTEYYLATGDKSVLKAIENLSEWIAEGQSGVGTYGHTFAWPGWNDGMVHGPVGGYGAMNQAGLPCVISLALAQKCGVRSSEVDAAVARGRAFFLYYVDLGGVPYGYHGPSGGSHGSNGKTSAAAVFFNILGDTEAATYFARWAIAASANGREGGHTGNYFNFLWGTLGAATAGDEAAHGSMEALKWYHDLERRRNGTVKYQCQLGGLDHGKYHGFDCTGARLLSYCVPRRAIYITGKECYAKILTDKEVADALEAGRWSDDGKSKSELMEDLASWSPVVRAKAAQALIDSGGDNPSKFARMLKSGNKYERYGGCEALKVSENAGTSEVNALIDLLEDSKDIKLRRYAMYVFFSWHGGIKRNNSAPVPVLLKLAQSYDPNDPLGREKDDIAQVLFGVGSRPALLKQGRKTETIDLDILVPGMKSLMMANSGHSREFVGSATQFLPDNVKNQLLGEAYNTVKYKSPACAMFNGASAWLKVIANAGYKEGMELAMDRMRDKSWGSIGRLVVGTEVFAEYYGAAAEKYYTEIKELTAPRLNDKWGGEMLKKNLATIDKNIKSGKMPSLKSISQYIIDPPSPFEFSGSGASTPKGTPRSPTATASAARSGPVWPPAKPKLRAPRKLDDEKAFAIEKALQATLTKLSKSGAIRPLPLRLSVTRATVSLAGVSSEGIVELKTPKGDTATLPWQKFTKTDHATFAMLVAKSKPENDDAQALAATYMEFVGDVKAADEFYAKAGESSRQKFEKLFEAPATPTSDQSE